MLYTEIMEVGLRKLYYTYSDTYYITDGKEVYLDAIDLQPKKYTETKIEIDKEGE